MNQQNSVSKNIIVNIKQQTLTLLEQETVIKVYLISTGKNGVGCMEGTEQTPLGFHHVAKKFGHGTPMNSVFIGRVATGEIYDNELGVSAPERDWILSRILWLSGQEEGINKGNNELGCCDTYQRYIYIHGTPDTEPMGIPMSHGCIRMKNTEVMELFDLVDEGIEVIIVTG